MRKGRACWTLLTLSKFVSRPKAAHILTQLATQIRRQRQNTQSHVFAHMKSFPSLSPPSLQCTEEFAQRSLHSAQRYPHNGELLTSPSPWQHPCAPWKADSNFVLYLHIQDNVSACVFPSSLQAKQCGEMSHPVSPQPCVS